MDYYNNLSFLLLGDEDAHNYYISLPLNVKEALISKKDSIHSLSDLQTAAIKADGHTI